jgi:hypothetical protein
MASDHRRSHPISAAPQDRKSPIRTRRRNNAFHLTQGACAAVAPITRLALCSELRIVF